MLEAEAADSQEQEVEERKEAEEGEEKEEGRGGVRIRGAGSVVEEGVERDGG